MEHLGRIQKAVDFVEARLKDELSTESIARVAAMLNRFPVRFLFSTDTVAPSGPAAYYAVFDIWAPVFHLLTPAASVAVRKGNYQRIFDAGRRNVRIWERTHAS